MASKYNVTLNGFPLELEHIDDTFAPSIAKHEFPYRNGALLENLGLKAITHKFKALWFGPTYPASFAVIELIKTTRDLLELVHPELGVLHGMVENVTVHRDDRQATAEMDFDFVLQFEGDPNPVQVINVLEAVEAAFEAGQTAQIDLMAIEMRTALGPEAAVINSKDLSDVLPSSPVLGKFSSLSSNARSYIARVDTVMLQYEALFNDTVVPDNSLVAVFNYGTTLPGRFIGIISRAMERVAELNRDTAAPASSLALLKAKLQAAEAAASDFPKHVKTAAAQRLTLETAITYQTDEANRRELRRREGVQSFDATGNFTAQSMLGPILSLSDVELSLAASRAYLQDALDNQRSMSVLKQSAKYLLDHVSSVKLEYERIVQLTLDNTMPLHLVCLVAGLPYSYAERLLAINAQIRRPNFTTGTVSVYVR